MLESGEERGELLWISSRMGRGEGVRDIAEDGIVLLDFYIMIVGGRELSERSPGRLVAEGRVVERCLTLSEREEEGLAGILPIPLRGGDAIDYHRRN